MKTHICFIGFLLLDEAQTEKHMKIKFFEPPCSSHSNIYTFNDTDFTMSETIVRRTKKDTTGLKVFIYDVYSGAKILVAVTMEQSIPYLEN